MIVDILNSLLWHARSGIRVEEINLYAGHGVADPNYRPPRLPYVAVIGPLNLETESERDLPRSLFTWVRSPGYLAGSQRSAEHAVPPPGTLYLRLDSDATIRVPLNFGALEGQPFTTPANGVQVAEAMEAALVHSIENGEVTTDHGPPDAARTAELRATTIRWDTTRHRLVISSGRRGVIASPEDTAQLVSRIQVLDGPGNLATELGFDSGAHAVDGRIGRHRIAAPTAVAVDVRMDLWAGSQQQLAELMARWSSITPTRGQLLTSPGLLARDVDPGDRVLSVQQEGESPTPWTLLQLEPEQNFSDRLSGTRPHLENGAVAGAKGIRFSGTATATLPLYPSRPIPCPWHLQHPAADGYALTCGIKVETPAAGQSARLLHLAHAGRTVLDIRLAILPDNTTDNGEFTVTAQHAGPSFFPAAHGKIDPEKLRAGVDLHVLVSAKNGLIRLYIDGTPLLSPSDSGEPAPGIPAGGEDMLLTLGDPTGAGFDFQIRYLQLHGRPFGPADPQLRRSLTPAAGWRVGDTISLARTRTGYSGRGDAFAAVVIDIQGDRLTLDRPVDRAWPLARTLLYKRSLFFSQKQLRRRDDFMNKLYRITAEYRISAFLEERMPATTALTVEETKTEIRVLARLMAEEKNPQAPDYPIRPVPGRPGVVTKISHS